MTAPRFIAGVAVTLAVAGSSCRGDDSAESGSTVTSTTPVTSTGSSSAPTSSAADTTASSPVSTGTSPSSTAADTTAPQGSQPATATTAVATTAAATATTAAASTTAATTTTTTTTVASWTAPTGDYSVAFPAEPGVFELPPPVEDSELPVTLYAVETDDYAVLTSRTDYSDYGIDAAGIDVEAARDLAVDRAAGELTASESVTVQGRDGLRYQFVVGDPQVGVGDGMLLLDGTVLFQVAGIGVDAERAFLSAFVDSFVFTEDR